jgi:hypothetical protein
VGRVDEQEEQLTVVGVCGGVADDSPASIGRDEEHVRRRMVGDQAFPVLRCEHGVLGGFAEVCPASPHCGVKDFPDGVRVRRHGAADLDVGRFGLRLHSSS